ncbi:MAG: hypothetical protein WBG70_07675 [Spirulinaceae cyanobacterium]
MKLALSNSASNNLALFNNLPSHFKTKLAEIWQNSYGELYEPVTDQATSLEDSLEEVLELLQDNNKTLTHLRYVWMALILAVLVQPTIKYYQPDHSIADEIIGKMALWLIKTIKATANNDLIPSIKTVDFDINKVVSSISVKTEKKLGSLQILYEALDVYLSAAKTLDENQSLEALMDILDGCLEGYALFGGSAGRRDLFNWWLLDVVPASWSLQPPTSFCKVNNSPNTKIIVSRQKEILDRLLSIITDESTFLTFYYDSRRFEAY